MLVKITQLLGLVTSRIGSKHFGLVSVVENSLITLCRIREQYLNDPLFVDLVSAINYAGELLAELDDSNQREPDMIGVMDGTSEEQFVTLVWVGVNPPSPAIRKDKVKINGNGHIDFTVEHDGELTAFFSESFEGYIQLITEMRETPLQSLPLEAQLPPLLN